MPIDINLIQQLSAKANSRYDRRERDPRQAYHYALEKAWPEIYAELLASRHLVSYLENALDLPETGLKKNVKAAIRDYRDAIKE